MVSVSRALTALLILALVCASSGDPDSAGTTESCTDKGEGGCSPDAAPSPPSNPSPPAPPSAEKAEPPSPPAAEKAEPPSAEKAETASDPVPSTENSQDCPSCYGAEDPARGLRCCKTCREVRRAYQIKGWAWPGNAKIASCIGTPEEPVAVAAATPAAVAPSAEKVECAKNLGCPECLSSGCGWCVGSRRCVNDKPWMCAGETDHIGRIGTRKQCPSKEEIAAKRDSRQAAREAGRIEPPKPSPDAGPPGGRGGAEGGKEDARAKWKEQMKQKQEEELQRVRNEGGAGGDGEEKEGAKVSEELIKEITQRAKDAGKWEEDPYLVLGVPVSAQAKDIRKAYRTLSLKLHPDKLQGVGADAGLRDLAKVAFMDVVAAYELLGDPEKRTAFDDMGSGEGQAQFHTFWEWQMYGKGKTEPGDFYRGEPLISKLTAALWPKRVTGDAIWLVEFYAPWCSACGTFVKPYKSIARSLEHEAVEVGAVNCEKDKEMCSEWFAIASYPMLMLVGSDERGTQQMYTQTNSKDAESVLKWVREVAEEWGWLYAQAKMPHITSEAMFDEVVLNSEALALAVFSDGLHCSPCRTAVTNSLRLAASLKVLGGAAQVVLVNCEEKGNDALCYQRAKLPPPPHLPQLRLFRRGKKDAASAPGYMGEMLVPPGDTPPHVALQVAEVVILAALAEHIQANSLSTGERGEFEDDTVVPPPEQPRPPPNWNGPEAADQPRGISQGRGRSGGGMKRAAIGR